MKRKEMLDQVTRILILDAALNIILEQGIEKLTMNRLAQGAGIAKGTLYLYFKDKRTLVRSALERGLSPFFNEMTTLLASDLGPTRKIEDFIQLSTAFLEKHRHFFNVFSSHMDAERSFYKEEDSPYWEMVRKIAQPIEEGIGQGIFKPHRAEFVACLLLEALSSYRHLYQMGKTVASAEENARVIADIFLSGIKT